MKLKDITFYEYGFLDAEERALYDAAIKFSHLKETDLFKLGSFEDRYFGFVKDFQFAINSKDEKGSTLFTFEKYLNLLKEYEKKQDEDFLKISIFTLIESYNYAIMQIRAINEKENTNLSHTPTNEEKRAGEGLFENMGTLIQIEKLSKLMNCDLLEVEKRPYSLCFALLKLSADRSEFQKEYNRIMNEK